MSAPARRTARFRAGRTARVVAAVLLAGCVAVVPVPAAAAPALPAFPGAEGFGAAATGGRGGAVVLVTTLEPFGPGSLGEALAPPVCEPRTVVFRVSGVVEVPGRHDLELGCGNLTVAGQTAPGAGITLRGRIDGYRAESPGNLIIRHLRIRPPPITDAEGAVDDLGQVYDALQLSNNATVMLDHLSLSWGSDETLDLYEFASDVTVQWSTVEQSNPQGQPEGPHNYGVIAGPDSPRVSIHHVLLAHHRSRCPAMASGPAELLNTVVYDCQDGFVHHNPAQGEFHIAGNTFVRGPSAEAFTPLYLDDEEPGDATYWLYRNDIRAPGVFEGVVDDISGTPLAEDAFAAGAQPGQVVTTPGDFAGESGGYVPVALQEPQDAYDAVLARAGAFPRDALTAATVEDVRGGGGDWTPDPPADLLAGLVPTAPPADADADGMADAWESANGLDPADGADHATVRPSGYTAIEEYVNGLSDALVGAAPPAATLALPAGAGSPAAGPSRGGGGNALVLATAGLAAVWVVLAGVALHVGRRGARR